MNEEERETERNESGPERLRVLRDEIKRRIDYRAFYLRYCPDARQSDARLQAFCPIPSHSHSGKGNPSLAVNLRLGLFNCFSRDEGGDCITFYELMHGVSFSRAVREMARDLGIGVRGRQSRPTLAQRAAPDIEIEETERPEPLDIEQTSAVCEEFLKACRRENQLEGISYLARRGINEATMRRAGVVYFPRRSYRRVMRAMLDSFPLDILQRSGIFNRKRHLTFYRHRLLFPFYVDGRAVYLQARTTASGVEPRWHNMRGAVPALYNADSLEQLPSGSTVFLVEGFTDTLTLVTHGFNAVGIVGAGGFKEDWLAPLGRFRVIAVLDPDAAGRRAAARYSELFSRRGASMTSLDLPSDVNDYFRHNPAAALELQLLAE